MNSRYDEIIAGGVCVSGVRKLSIFATYLGLSLFNNIFDSENDAEDLFGKWHSFNISSENEEGKTKL